MGKAVPCRVALTGSIAMGKSTVAQMFRDAGIPVFDADAEVHKLYSAGGQAVPHVAEFFPDSLKHGSIDRAALSKLVLGNQTAMKRLEEIVHPLVLEAQVAFMDKAAGSGKKIVVFDIPLLFEADRQLEFDVVLVVSAPVEVQRQRALARPGIDDYKLDAILARQVSDEQKRKGATYIISTGVPIEDTRTQVLDIIDRLQEWGGANSNA